MESSFLNVPFGEYGSFTALAADSGRMTRYSEVKVRCGLVPTNALVFTDSISLA
jgi:hypothetical protein